MHLTQFHQYLVQIDKKYRKVYLVELPSDLLHVGLKFHKLNKCPIAVDVFDQFSLFGVWKFHPVDNQFR